MESPQSEQPAAYCQTQQETEPHCSEEPATEGGLPSEKPFAENEAGYTCLLTVQTMGGEVVLGPCVQRAAMTGWELSEMLSESSAVAVPKPFKMLLGERVLDEEDSVSGSADGPEPVLVTLVAHEPPWLDYNFESTWDYGSLIVKAQRSTLEEVCRKTWGSKVDCGLQLLTDTLGSIDAKDALGKAPKLAEGLLSHVRAAKACECFLWTEYQDRCDTYKNNKCVDAFCGGLYISIVRFDEEYRS